MSSAKAAGSSLNLSLQFFSKDVIASRTLLGFSSLVLAARHRSFFASWISTSDAADVVVDERNITEGVGFDAFMRRVLVEEVDKEAGVEKAEIEAAPSSHTPERRMRIMMVNTRLDELLAVLAADTDSEMTKLLPNLS